MKDCIGSYRRFGFRSGVYLGKGWPGRELFVELGKSLAAQVAAVTTPYMPPKVLEPVGRGINELAKRRGID